jgi:hypothetical protein
VRSEAPTPENLCRGTLLSKFMYLTDVQHWGFEDVRLPPRGIMSPQDITHFTAT